LTYNSPERLAGDIASSFQDTGTNYSEFDVLPIIPPSWLDDSFCRHLPDELELVLRHKIVPVSWIPPLVLHAVVSERAMHEAWQKGLKVVARIAPAHYEAAVRRQHGRLLLRTAVRGLAKHQPEMSASRRLSAMQAAIIAGLAGGAAILGFTNGAGILAFAAAVSGTLFFTLVIAIRIYCLLPSPLPRPPAPPDLADNALPIYSVLVPVFRETAILGQLIRALMGIDYPNERLDIKLILEEGDIPMLRAVAQFTLPPHFEIVVVPAGKPQTKPRALSYALQFVRGSLVTIYDAEDIPHSQQLRLAAAAFAAAPSEVACLQASLSFFNPDASWLTRQFAAEYAGLFNLLLPALAERGLPILLGGTSNHFRREALETCGGWDPFNVTEDADLGLRLARLGFRCDVLASETLEEANLELGNWLRQRRRWLKGFLQCWLVHMREPFRLYRELGTEGFWTAQCLTVGVFGSALFHPFLLAFSIWSLSPGNITMLPNTVFSHLLAGTSVAVLLGGYVVSMAMAAQGLARQGMKKSWRVIASLPCYWLLMSVAAWLAVWDFAIRPFHWHKTRHGFSSAPIN
jgi:cellulose synthase/poly-beta-1,6-N-acetylglucosamine synthase-like glycosyltransferase